MSRDRSRGLARNQHSAGGAARWRQRQRETAAAAAAAGAPVLGCPWYRRPRRRSWSRQCPRRRWSWRPRRSPQPPSRRRSWGAGRLGKARRGLRRALRALRRCSGSHSKEAGSRGREGAKQVTAAEARNGVRKCQRVASTAQPCGWSRLWCGLRRFDRGRGIRADQGDGRVFRSRGNAVRDRIRV
eukprot:249121-Chlamydomonas_euryale.AAC.16